MANVQIPQIRFDDVRGKHILIALSGGADSVALACLLARARERCALRLTAAHLHHGIRGADADADAALCRQLCQNLGIELVVGRAEVPRIAHEHGEGLETAAREERYRFLREVKQRCGADVIALAHHLDDQAETVLMHLLRGAGPEGICGMVRLRGDLYRPLLEVRRDALRQFLAGEGISWREDASNGAADNPRNALRLNVMPEIEKSYPLAAEAIARYARAAQVESDCLARQTDAFGKDFVHRGPYGWRVSVHKAEEAILRRAIRRICGGDLSTQNLDAAIALCARTRGRVDLSGGWIAEKAPDALYLLPREIEKPAAVPLSMPGAATLRGVCRIEVDLGDFPIDPEDPDVEVVDAEVLGGATLRTRIDGDRIHPLGAPGDRLLSDFLIDRKVDRPLRDYLPLIAVGNRVLWAGGLGIAEEARIQETTRARARIRMYPITDEEPEVYR